MPDEPLVLAVALDSADWEHLGGLIADGTMPNLRRYVEDAQFFAGGADPYVTSGALWPSFITASPPEAHGLFYGYTRWDPEAMTIVADPPRFEPFWRELDRSGVELGLLDVPYGPHAGVRHGFEVTDWGPHEMFPGAQPLIAATEPVVLPRHPFQRRFDPLDSADAPELDALAAACVASAGLRAELLTELVRSHRPRMVLACFTEIHHAAHFLWHRHDDVRAVHAAVDAALGEVLALAGPDTEVTVFSLQGLRPGPWAPAFLPDVLRASGHWVPARPGHAAGALAAIKARVPEPLRRTYRQRLPYGLQRAIAAPNMFPTTDWRRTRAVTWVSEQNGLIRLNLQGREAQGVVAPGELDAVRRELVELLSTLHDDAGRPLVRRVIALGSAERPSITMPDLVVHWTEAAFADPVTVTDPPITSRPGHEAIVARHRFEGFGLARSPRATPERIDVEELAGFLTAPLR